MLLFSRLLLSCILVLNLFISLFVHASENASDLKSRKYTTPFYLSFEQRLAISYALLSQGLPEDQKILILGRSKQHFKSILEKGYNIVEVDNFRQFVEKFRGEWPNTYSLKLDLEEIESRGAQPISVFKSKNPRVQRQIDHYLKWQLNQIQDKIYSQSGYIKNKIVNSDESALLAQAAVGVGYSILLDAHSQSKIETFLLREIDHLISNKLDELHRVGVEMAKSKLGGDAQDRSKALFLEVVFSEYFKQMSSDTKKLLISGFLGENLYSSDLEKFKIMIQGSGPILQKLLQIIARDQNTNQELRSIFQELEKSVRPVSWTLVEKLLQSEKNNYDFIYFEKKPLGVGTMAQVHRAKILLKGLRQDVVVRFIKPGIESRVYEDKNILTQIAKTLDANSEFRALGAPALSPMVDDISQTVIAELDQSKSIEMQKIARNVYSKSLVIDSQKFKSPLEIKIPQVYPPKNNLSSTNSKSAFMVQEMVFGSNLENTTQQYKSIAPDLKKTITEELARTWINEAIFGSGFYHSDLHQGNFLIQINEPQITVSLLDYGMSGIIDVETQRKMMLLGAGIDLLNADWISNAYWAVSDKNGNKISQEIFFKRVADKIKNIKSGVELRPKHEEWMVWALDQGIKLPYEFINLNRGIVIINSLLKSSGSLLTVSSLMKRIAYTKPTLVYQRLVIDEKISHLDLIKLGWVQVQQVVHNKFDEKFRIQLNQENKNNLICSEIFVRN